MNTLSSPRLVAVLVFVMMMALMIAAPLSAHAQAAEDVWATISVELYQLGDGEEPLLVMSGLTLDDLELPIDAAISIPKGSDVIWVGQVVDGVEPNAWPALEYKLVEGEKYDMLEFTMEQSLRANIELVVPEGFITDGNGGRVVDLEWISGGSSGRARVGVSTPHAFYLDDPQPTPVIDVRMDDILYSIETSPVARGSVLRIGGTPLAGEEPELTRLKEEGAAAAAEASAAAEPTVAAEPFEVSIDTGGLPWNWIIGGLLAVVLATIAVLLYRMLNPSTADGDDDGAEDSDDDVDMPSASDE